MLTQTSLQSTKAYLKVLDLNTYSYAMHNTVQSG